MTHARLVEDTPTWKLTLLVLVTSISLFEFGYNTASISGVLLYIDAAEFDCSQQAICLMNSVQKGYVVSSCLFGACFGALMAGSLADRFGRRTVLLANNVFFILGPLGMAMAPTVHILAAARAIAGIGVGISSALVHVYIGENVPASRRGEQGAILVMMGTGGILVSTLASWLLQDDWRTVLGLAILPAMLQLVLGPLFMPESPAWLRMQQGRAQSSDHAAPLLHVDAMPRSSEREGGWMALVKAARTGQVTSALVVGLGLNILQQVSGINVVVYYGPKVLSMAGFPKEDLMLLSALLSAVQMMATLLLARLVDRLGRRPMSFVGLALMAVSLATLGAAFELPIEDSKWLAVWSLLIFRVAFSLSLGPLPYIITAEIFPLSCRASGVSLCWSVNWFSNCLVSMTFLPIMEVLHPSNTFFMYAVVSIITLIFVKFCVPETSGKTLDVGSPPRSRALSF